MRRSVATGLPNFPPHRLRNTLTLLGERLCRNPEEFNAWSQNLGHEQLMTTLLSYGEVSARRQAEIIRELARPAVAPGGVAPALIDVARKLQEAGLVARPAER